MWWEGLPIYVLLGLIALELLTYAFAGSVIWRWVGGRRGVLEKPKEEEETPDPNIDSFRDL